MPKTNPSFVRRFLYRGKYAPLRQCGLGTAVAFALAGLGLVFHLNLTTASLFYLLLVVTFAVHCGFWQASVISVIAVLCETYFFAPPRFSFYIADPKNGLALIIFEVTVVIVSRVSSREKQHAVKSELDKRRTQKLYSVSNDILLLDPQSPPERQIAEFIAREFELDSVCILSESPGETGVAGRWRNDTRFLQEIRKPNGSRLAENISRRALCSANGEVGVLLVEGDISGMAMDSLAALVVLALERHRAFVNESFADAARRTEQLRTTVLDGLAHAIKTPLTIIRAASSGLLEVGNLDAVQGQLAAMIDEQSVRIEDLATRLLRTARVEGENLCLQLELVNVSELMNEVVREFQDGWPEQAENCAEGPTINIACSRVPKPIAADHEMLSTTLHELLTNAAKYSYNGSPITISAEDGLTELTLSVHSYGPTIPPQDRERVFEKFYRGVDHRHSAPGTGLGLSVARRVTEAHGGQIWFTSDDEDGTTFRFSLPRNRSAEPASEWSAHA